jgi:hypothetical protein
MSKTGLGLERFARAAHADHDAARIVTGGHEDALVIDGEGRGRHRHIEFALEFSFRPSPRVWKRPTALLV